MSGPAPTAIVFIFCLSFVDGDNAKTFHSGLILAGITLILISTLLTLEGVTQSKTWYGFVLMTIASILFLVLAPTYPALETQAIWVIVVLNTIFSICTCWQNIRTSDQECMRFACLPCPLFGNIPNEIILHLLCVNIFIAVLILLVFTIVNMVYSANLEQEHWVIEILCFTLTWPVIIRAIMLTSWRHMIMALTFTTGNLTTALLAYSKNDQSLMQSSLINLTAVLLMLVVFRVQQKTNNGLNKYVIISSPEQTPAPLVDEETPIQTAPPPILMLPI